MVAVIKTGRSIYGALAYNERKVTQGVAVSLGVINSMAQAERQDLVAKHKLLQELADRNARTKRNAYHIALSFVRGDELNVEQLRDITRDYLRGIGFGTQPAYVYRHHDTAHDHLHVVTTNICRDGRRIKDSFIGRTKSEAVRKAIEAKYQLGQAGDPTGPQIEEPVPPRPPEQLVALSLLARHWIPETLKGYKPSGVGELNALLRERGLRVIERWGKRADGRVYMGYLVSRVNAPAAQAYGVRIKAAKVFAKGWSTATTEQFAENKRGKAREQKRVSSTIAELLDRPVEERTDLRQGLAQVGISTIEHPTNERQSPPDIYYVDEQTGYIFPASELRKSYCGDKGSEEESLR